MPLLPGMGNKLRQQWSLGNACAVAVIPRRTDDGKDGGRTRHTNDTDVHLRIHHVIVVILLKWFTEFGHLNRGDMLTSEQHR